MTPKSKPTQKRTKADGIPKAKRQVTGKDMRKVKGGLAADLVSKTTTERLSSASGKCFSYSKALN